MVTNRHVAKFFELLYHDNIRAFPNGRKIFQSEAAVEDLGQMEYYSIRHEFEDGVGNLVRSRRLPLREILYNVTDLTRSYGLDCNSMPLEKSCCFFNG